MAEVEEQQFENYEEQPAVVATEEAEADALVYGTTAELPEIKLFGRWSCDDVHVSDMSLAVSTYTARFSKLCLQTVQLKCLLLLRLGLHCR